MASLRLRERVILEEFLGMAGGYVLDFSERTFAEFFRDFAVDINESVYKEGHSGSKANRMRRFWDRGSDALVGEVLHELVAYAEALRPGHPRAEACRAIAARLKAHQTPRPEWGMARPQVRTRPVEIFFSYAHEDEALMDVVRIQLVIRERLGEIVKWYDRMIPAGDEWRTRIDDRIERAHLILLFMSPDFLASRYCYEVEGGIALRRHRAGAARVIPVVLRACDWTITPFGELQALPRDGIPLTLRPDRDQASLEVAQGIMDSID